MDACKELVSAMRNHAESSQRDADIESVALDIRRILRELDIAKLEGKRDAEKIKAMIEDWERLSFERAMFESEVTAQKVRIDELKSERDRDVRRAVRTARLKALTMTLECIRFF